MLDVKSDYVIRNRNKQIFILLVVSFCFLAAQSFAAPAKPNQNPGSPPGVFNTTVPQHDLDIILGRPSLNGITLSVLSYQDAEGYCEYGVKPGEFTFQTKPVKLTKGEPMEIALKGLQPDTRYFYRFGYRRPEAKEYTRSGNFTFQTQRPPGKPFVFAVQADPHLDENTSVEMYKTTLANQSAAGPDFLIDLGDTFMTNKYRGNFKDSFRQYLSQRYYFGSVCHSAALYLTLGNHDGEGWIKTNSPDDMTVWATTVRKHYYPNPFPDGFYTGNEANETLTGQPQNYYAWEWGDALFVVLDPYRYTRSDTFWDRTLGEQQYRWLVATLTKSKARFKFIFIHNLVGGADLNGKARGGAEVVPYYEWGGLNGDGTPGFAQHRPGWGKPIHQLLVENHVSAVFHGHDHFLAHQEQDGIVYQLVPQPGQPGTRTTTSAAEYGYRQGTILPAPGYLRLTVTPDRVTVDYIRSYLPPQETGGNKNGQVGYSYIIKPR